MANLKKPLFNIIRYRGTPNKATTKFGLDVERRESIFISEYKKFIPCAPYSDHFVFEVPEKYKGLAGLMCTCGSFAAIVGLSGYEQDASPSGLMILCHHHAKFGVHATGGAKWI